ncbi:MAG: hypothetical protein KDA67_07750 [Rhodobacteraceae bacterium]|nr:hypothetical protein [Paracoccaceae bacterium]
MSKPDSFLHRSIIAKGIEVSKINPAALLLEINKIGQIIAYLQGRNARSCAAAVADRLKPEAIVRSQMQVATMSGRIRIAC